MAGHVIRHEHVRIVHGLQGECHLDHVQVAFIGVDLLEIVPPAANVAEVDVEYLAALAEVAEERVDFPARIGLVE
jgi:hypothetical protein